ncbi:hypothetical protein PTI98_007970 [Pleurotus ostreatus]|nr:hypothetical protein PTI98_007970 [Pleurotus ostreatus]
MSICMFAKGSGLDELSTYEVVGDVFSMTLATISVPACVQFQSLPRRQDARDEFVPTNTPLTSMGLTRPQSGSG